MRNLFLKNILLLSSVLYASCASNEIKKTYRYQDYENLKISWNSVFFCAKTHYFAYIYSEDCLHCQNIKDDILWFVDADIFPLYLIEYSSEISVGLEPEKTIGASSIDSVYILGVPTLIEIEDKILTSNEAGEKRVLALLYSKKK